MSLPRIAEMVMDGVDPGRETSVSEDGSSLGAIVFRGPKMVDCLKESTPTSSCMPEDVWGFILGMFVLHILMGIRDEGSIQGCD
ncbi:hypothetical protein GOBAR_AA32541 [Gossypium barbadense]|uniref:Uncharacterized protein n=1 Tax=Gossypium barbadense TaxID=3634 RepID=A0A2P5WAQ6_GOSBA|nr:hypothetical protein GOBAR_AA32541 [Gossypium barbadense]